MRYCYFYSYIYIFVLLGKGYCNNTYFPEWLWRYCWNSWHPGGPLTAVPQESYSQMCRHKQRTWITWTFAYPKKQDGGRCSISGLNVDICSLDWLWSHHLYTAITFLFYIFICRNISWAMSWLNSCAYIYTFYLLLQWDSSHKLPKVRDPTSASHTLPLWWTGTYPSKPSSSRKSGINCLLQVLCFLCQLQWEEA